MIIFLIFTIFQLAFRSVQSSVQNKRDQIRRILQLPPPPAVTTTTTPSSMTSSMTGSSPSTSGASSGAGSDDDTSSSNGHHHLDIKSNSVIGKSFRKDDNDNCDTESVVSVVFSNATVDPKAANDLEAAISVYLRRATENFDLSKNVEVKIKKTLKNCNKF